MPSSHSEFTADINEGDMVRVAAAITSVRAGAGMSRFAVPALAHESGAHLGTMFRD